MTWKGCGRICLWLTLSYYSHPPPPKFSGQTLDINCNWLSAESWKCSSMNKLVKARAKQNRRMFICKSKNTAGRLTSISDCFHPRHKSARSEFQSLNDAGAVLWLADLNIKGPRLHHELISVHITWHECKSDTPCSRDFNLFQTFKILSLSAETGLNPYIISLLKPSGHFMHHQV
jgi:hypothetical protein